MAVAFGRRTVLVAGAAIGLAGAAAILAFRATHERARTADDVTADYVDGRLVVVDGWIMSATEADGVPEGAGPREVVAVP